MRKRREGGKEAEGSGGAPAADGESRRGRSEKVCEDCSAAPLAGHGLNEVFITRCSWKCCGTEVSAPLTWCVSLRCDALP